MGRRESSTTLEQISNRLDKKHINCPFPPRPFRRTPSRRPTLQRDKSEEP